MNKIILAGLSVLLMTFTTTILAGDLQERIKEFESSAKVQTTLRHMHSHVLKSSKGLCATFVRQGYQASGLFEGHPGISNAKDYKPFFEKEEWTNLLGQKHFSVSSDLYNSPAGCAVVYDAINPRNDRNGYIGHIETRTKRGKANGFISDYYSNYPRSGLECVKSGKVIKRLRTFKARESSPYHKDNQNVRIHINVTSCDEYSARGATMSDEFINRKVIGVFCRPE